MTVTVEAVRTVVTPDKLRDGLTACLLSASKDKMLPVLCAVQVEKVGTELTFRSTDRYRLTRVTVKLDEVNAAAPDFVGLLVDVADVKRIVAALPKAARYAAEGFVGLEVDNGALVVTTEASTLRVQPVEGQFPRTDMIWPAFEKEVAEVGFNPTYLADLAKMPGKSRNAPVKFAFAAPGKPVTVTWGDDADIKYEHLLMPVRVNS